jgi:hypothetical protein
MQTQTDLNRYLSLKLAALGQPTTSDSELLDLARPLLRNLEVKERLLRGHLCPADARIQWFLDQYLKDVCPTGAPRLPGRTMVLDQAGLARLMSFPSGANEFSSPYLHSYRIRQGVLHNPSNDRRTTQGVFHVAEGGFPIPADKQVVPKAVFAKLLEAALLPPADTQLLPYTANQSSPARLFVSLLIRPLVCPATERDGAKRMEIRFFAPGTLVSNLDFVESIFGNGGDPQLPENDAALDAFHWTGHSGCVILAPHLTGLKKAALGLPHHSVATERQRRDGMCWKSENEPYNGGSAFKICARDHRGVMVTIIADNYYGYCKKEVKTQISFSANLYGGCEEEHAGGAIAFATYILGQDFYADRTVSLKKNIFQHTLDMLGPQVDVQPQGYAIDRRFPDIYYVPENANFQVRASVVQWQHAGSAQQLTLKPGVEYLLPSGFRVRLEKQLLGGAWRLIGSRPRGTLCHKPSTVSGGGKSEISKSLANSILKGPVFVRDYHRDMEEAEAILEKDYSGIYKERTPDARTRRPILSMERSLGSVIQLLTPSSEYTDEYNAWLESLAPTTRQLIFTIKRYYRPEWGENWRAHFTVDRVNGVLGNELKFDDQALVSNYLRVGYDSEGGWRVFKLRPDFHPSEKVQVEDDITVSTVVPRESLTGLDAEYAYPSVKLVSNCETLLFQRPDSAIHPGQDHQAELDMASPGNFISNYEPLTKDGVRALEDRIVEFDLFSDPMKTLLQDFARSPGAEFVVSSAHPRLVNGKRSLNPRYLQQRPDLVNPRSVYLAEIAARLERDIPSGEPVHFPVNAVLAGRRGNRPDPASGVPPLAVYSPLHYQELPELFMEFIASLTGKSPATTGFGSEGALTKGPFNALSPVIDLNDAVVSYILTGYAGFTSSAGYIGPSVRVDHDVSLLVPEIWCRMRVKERDSQYLIANGFLEQCQDFEYNGRPVRASLLGYRITRLFVDRFLGRIFETPQAVFPEEMLRPEEQDAALFADGMEAIVDTQRRVALHYFEDGSIAAASPPIRALLHIMAHGHFEGCQVNEPCIRSLFTREALLESEWYLERLRTKQAREKTLWQRHLRAAEEFAHSGLSSEDLLDGRLDQVRLQLARVSSPDYLKELISTTGADPGLKSL